MSEAMTFCRIPGSTATQTFMLFLGSFSDMLNVQNLDESAHKCKEDLKPYRSPNDERLKGVMYMTDYVDKCLQFCTVYMCIYTR